MQNKIELSPELFFAKCAKLNVPADVLPDEQYLKKIISTSSLFERIISNLDSKNEVTRRKKKILRRKMQNIKQNSIINSNPNALPEEFKNILAYERACQKIKDHEQANVQEKEVAALERVKEIDVRKRMEQKKLGLKQTRLDILQACADKLDEDIKKEEGIAQELNKKERSVTDVEEVSKRINRAKEILKDFSNKGLSTSAAKEKAYKEVVEQIQCIPNSVIFDFVLNLLKAKSDDSIFNGHSKKFSSTLKDMVDKFIEIKIITGLDLVEKRCLIDEVKQLCAIEIHQVQETLDHNQTSMYFDDDDEDLNNEYVCAYVAKLIQEGKVNYFKEKIAFLNEKNITRDENAFENTILSIQESNQQINDKIGAIQSHVAYIYQINEKYKFNNLKVMRTMNNLKLEQHSQMNRTAFSQAMNNTTLNSTVIAQTETGLEEAELELFLSIPMSGEEKLNFEAELLFASSHITRLRNQDPVKFLRALKLLESNVQRMNELNEELPSSIDVEEIQSQDHFLSKINQLRDEKRKEISTTFDQIVVSLVSINRLFDNVEKMYKFIKDNPLRKFVDPEKKFENKSFIEYENDYMLYYKMIKK